MQNTDFFDIFYLSFVVSVDDGLVVIGRFYCELITHIVQLGHIDGDLRDALLFGRRIPECDWGH
jgi:hypothetical protein